MLFSLDCLTIGNNTPFELLEVASESGFDSISLWLNPLTAYPKQLLEQPQLMEFGKKLADSDVSLQQIEAFDIGSGDLQETVKPALDNGAALGAQSILVYHGANPGSTFAADQLAQLVELAKTYKIEVNLEPVAVGSTRTLAQAEKLIQDAGVDIGVVLDTLHFFRMSQTCDDLTQLPPNRIRYIQFNDGKNNLDQQHWISEAMGERALPGEGEFPIGTLLAKLPQDITWAIEAPSQKRSETMSLLSQAENALAALKAIHQQSLN